MSSAELVEHLKRMSNADRLVVIEAVLRLVREDLGDDAQATRPDEDRIRAAALAVKDLYESGGEHDTVDTPRGATRAADEPQVKLELRSIVSGDIRRLRTWVPASPAEVYVQVTIGIGEAGMEGVHFFKLMVATPEGLNEVAHAFPNHDLPDRNLLVFRSYSWEALVQRLERIVNRCCRPTWDESVHCLERFFEWEYEDHQVEGGS
jgi:hypothetical protein